MAEVLSVEVRKNRGTRNARQLRRAGKVPAVLYGHAQETISLAVPVEQMDAVVRHGTRVVELAGAVSQQAFILQLQWDTWATHILHVDFTRISAHERVRVQVALELRGEAPGVKEGGLVEQTRHELDYECEAASIPEKLIVNINNLKLGESITVAQLELSDGAAVLNPPETVVVQCVEPAAVPEEEELGGEEAEPEVIGRKAEEEGEEKS